MPFREAGSSDCKHSKTRSLTGGHAPTRRVLTVGPAASGRRCDDHGRDLDLIATSAGPISGLPRDSIVNVTTLMTLDKTGLDSQAGYLPASLMGEVDRGLRRVLG